MPEYQILRRKRARLSWGLSIPLVAAYLLFGLLCVYAPDLLGAPLASDPYITWALVLAYLLMVLSVVAAVVYVRVSNRDLEPAREALLRELGRD